MSRRRYEIKKFRALLETSSDQKMDGEFVFEQKECVAFWREISAGLRLFPAKRLRIPSVQTRILRPSSDRCLSPGEHETFLFRIFSDS